MFDKGFVQQLKQSNISVDAEATRKRVAQEWKSTSRSEQTAVLALAGVARASVQRAYKTGCISAKLVVSLAQTLNISPLYLIGRSDERGEYDEDVVLDLLQQHGYSKLLRAQSYGMGKRKKKMPRPTDLQGGIGYAELSPEVQAMADALTEDDMALLLRSALLRAKAGGHYAELAQRLKLLLLA